MNPVYEVIISGKDLTKQAFDSIGGNIGKINGLVAGLGVSVSAAGFAGLIKQAADFNDEMGDMAQTLGTTTEGLSALQYAAKFGGGVEELNTGLTKLAKNANDAANGSKTAQASFDKLGIDPSKFNDTSVLFEAIVEQLSLMPDGIQKTALAQELLGKSGAKLLPLINGGKEGLKAMREEAEKLGLVVSQQDAAAAGEFNDNLDRLSLTSKGLATQFGNQFIPVMTEISARMVDAAKEGGILQGVLEGLSATGQIILFGDESERRFDRIKELNEDIKTYKTRLDTIKSGDSIIEAIYGKDETTQKLQAARKELRELITLQSEAANRKVDPTKPAAPTGVVKDAEAEKKAEAAAKAAASFVDSLKKQADQLGLTKTEQIAYEASLLKLTEAQRKVVEISAAKIDAYEREKEAVKELADFEKLLRDSDDRQLDTDVSISDDEAARLAQREADYVTFRDRLTEQNEQLNIDLIENDKERAKAQLELENARAVERIQAMMLEQEQVDELLQKQAENYGKQLEKIEQSSNKTGSAGKELGLLFKSGFEDAVVSGADFGDVLAGLEQDIIRLAARRVILQPLLDAFDDLLSGGGSGVDSGGGIMNFVSSLFKANAKGDVYSGAGISAFSNQVVSSPTFFPFAKGVGLMGEAGPEAIVPLKRGANGSLGISAEGMGGGKVTVNIINPPSQASVQQSEDGQGNITLDVMFERIKSELSKDIRKNGQFANAMQDQYSLSRVGGAS